MGALVINKKNMFYLVALVTTLLLIFAITAVNEQYTYTLTAQYVDGITSIGGLPAFFINPAQTRQIALPTSALQWTNKQCTPVFLLGGQKSGSTTLWLQLLKDNAVHHEVTKHDPNLQFAISKKELCTAKHSTLKPGDFWSHFGGCQNEDNQPHKFALDACPAAISEHHMKTLASRFPAAKLIMLVRDPVKRILSHVNAAQMNGRGNPDIESVVKSIITSRRGLEWQLSQYADILKAALKYFDSEQILIIKNERFESDVQSINDAVMDHIGGQRFPAESIQANSRSQSEKYKHLSAETLHMAYESLNPQIQEFITLTGQQFPEWKE